MLLPHLLAADSTDEGSPGKRKSVLIPVCSLVPAGVGNALECSFAEEQDFGVMTYRAAVMVVESRSKYI